MTLLEISTPGAVDAAAAEVEAEEARDAAAAAVLASSMTSKSMNSESASSSSAAEVDGTVEEKGERLCAPPSPLARPIGSHDGEMSESSPSSCCAVKPHRITEPYGKRKASRIKGGPGGAPGEPAESKVESQRQWTTSV